jgi:hypothetical protein
MGQLDHMCGAFISRADRTRFPISEHGLNPNALDICMIDST